MRTAVLLMCLLIRCVVVHAEENARAAVKLTPSGECYQKATVVHRGRTRKIVNAAIDTRELENSVFQSIGARLALTATVAERLKIHFAYDGHLWHDITLPDEVKGNTRNMSGGLHLGYADYAIGALERPVARITGGYFNHTYAPEVQDLGGYLLKSGVHPGYVLSGGEGLNVLGLRATVTPATWLRADALVTSEINVVPAFDLSPTLIVHANAAQIVTVGLGVMWHRLFSVNPPNTEVEKNWPEHPVTQEKIPVTLKGTKVMGRVVVDPKQFIDTERLGEMDLKLYAEAAILGTEEISTYYEELSEKTVAMIGFYVPTFKVLDALAVELEYYGSPYMNNPYNDANPVAPANYVPGDKDNIKWAVTARKSVLKGMDLMARVARDHIRMETGAGWYAPEELTPDPGDWYGTLEFRVRF